MAGRSTCGLLRRGGEWNGALRRPAVKFTPDENESCAARLSASAFVHVLFPESRARARVHWVSRPTDLNRWVWNHRRSFDKIRRVTKSTQPERRRCAKIDSIEVGTSLRLSSSELD